MRSGKIWGGGKDVEVSKNSGTPKSSILIGFSIVNHPFWGTTIFGNTYVLKLNALIWNSDVDVAIISEIGTIFSFSTLVFEA